MLAPTALQKEWYAGERGPQSPATGAKKETRLDAGKVLKHLRQKLLHHWHGADNAFVVIGLTMEDMSDSEGILEQERLLRHAKAIEARIKRRIAEHRSVLTNALLQGKEAREKARREEAELEAELEVADMKKRREGRKLREMKAYISTKVNLEMRTAIFSFARIDPHFGMTKEQRRKEIHGNPESGQRDHDALIRRACKSSVHHILHMMGIRHCQFFHCRMNGSASMRSRIFLHAILPSLSSEAPSCQGSYDAKGAGANVSRNLCRRVL